MKLYFGIIDPFLIYSLKVNWIDFVLALVIIIYINNIKAVQLNVLFSFVHAKVVTSFITKETCAAAHKANLISKIHKIAKPKKLALWVFLRVLN